MKFKQAIELKLKSFESKILNKSIIKIIKTISKIKANYIGPISIPTKIYKFIVNKSPYIDKKSREQFQIKSHIRMLIIEASSKTIDALMKLDISSGIDIKIKMRKENEK